jgi:microcystin-dependent protein
MEPLWGEIRLFPYIFAPVGWAACDGAQVRIQDNSTLFSLIGTAFGGNGTEFFNLPDLRDKSPLPEGAQGGYYIAVEGDYPRRP